MFIITAPIILGVFTANAGSADQVHQWGIFDTSVEADKDHDNPLQDVNLEVEFTDPDGKIRRCEGFWDGDRKWRVRFSPYKIGEWKWHSRCEDDSGLNDKGGVFTCVEYSGENPLYSHGAVRVSDNGWHFAHADGTPFFWMVDTVWNGVLLSDEDDWARFLENRVSKNFTGIQFVTTQWRAAYANAEGQVAYSGFEGIRIYPEFFSRMDQRMDALNASGLLAAPVMLWTLGEKEHNPGQLPESQAILLARYIKARYGAHIVIWMLPGDGNYSGENGERWRRIGRAVFDTEGHAPVFLHPCGMNWPYDEFLDEKWLSALGYQSGHGDSPNTLRWIYSGPPAQNWDKGTPRPVINLEPPYENHIAYQSRKPHTAHSVRRAVYWSLMNAPTAGVTYGAHGIWSWPTTPSVPKNHDRAGVAQPWHVAMNFPGSEQMGYMVELFTSIDWWRLRPAELVVQPDLTGDEGAGKYISSSCSDEGDLAVIYSPVGGEISLKPGVLKEGLKVYWFNPRTGDRNPAEEMGENVYETPDDQDWVLLFQAD